VSKWCGIELHYVHQQKQTTTTQKQHETASRRMAWHYVRSIADKSNALPGV
jgi:hypothetical protein